MESDELWPFTWSAPTRAMNYLEVEWAQADERRRTAEAIESVGAATQETSASFAAMIGPLQQLREALRKICEDR